MSFKFKDLHAPFYFIRLEFEDCPNTFVYYTKGTVAESNSVNAEKEGTHRHQDEAEMFSCLQEATKVAARIEREWNCGRVFIHQYLVKDGYYAVLKGLKVDGN